MLYSSVRKYQQSNKKANDVRIEVDYDQWICKIVFRCTMSCVADVAMKRAFGHKISLRF